MMDGMKQTGIRWIGEIPVDWNTKRVKYMANLKGRIGWQGLTSEEYQDEGAFLITGVDFLNGHINWEQCEHVPMKRWEEAKDIQIQNGDLLITKDGTVGKVAIVSDLPGETSLNSGVLRILPIEGYSSRFLYWVLQSDVFWNWFNFRNAGNSTIIHLYQGDFEEFIYAFPKYDEQEKIADWLDNECAKRDVIVKDLEDQISLLEKYKKSVIYEIITKNSNNCKYGRVKDLMTLQRGQDLPQDDFIEGNIPVYGSNGIIGFHNRKTTEAPCITIGRSGSVGELNYIDRDFWAHNTSIYVKNAKANNMRYLFYVLSTIDIKELANGSAVPTLDRKNVEAVHLWFIPDITLQRHLAEMLDRICEKVDVVIKAKKDQIDIVKRQKQSFIYEYVTGKKRVKEVI